MFALLVKRSLIRRERSDLRRSTTLRDSALGSVFTSVVSTLFALSLPLLRLPLPVSSLFPCVYMHRPREEKREAAGGCFVAAVGFSLRFLRGMFPSLVNISIDSLRPRISSLVHRHRPPSSILLPFRLSFSTVAYYWHGSAFSSVSVNPRRHLLIQINHSRGSPAQSL